MYIFRPVTRLIIHGGGANHLLVYFSFQYIDHFKNRHLPRKMLGGQRSNLGGNVFFAPPPCGYEPIRIKLFRTSNIYLNFMVLSFIVKYYINLYDNFKIHINL